jgi:diacylglycerol O-acyltransferase
VSATRVAPPGVGAPAGTERKRTARGPRPRTGPSTRFSGADSSWWHMERETNQMVVTAVLLLDGPLDLDRLRAILADRLMGYDRFHQRVLEAPTGVGRPLWVEDPDFDLDRHLETRSLPDPADGAALQRLVGEEMTRPLAYDRPLWRMVYVDDCATGSALVARVHHCIADGLALVRILLTLDEEVGNEDDSYARFRPPPGVLHHGLAMGARVVASLGHVAGMRPDPRSTLRGELVPEKRAAWSRPVGIETFRAAAKAAGGTINDLVLSTIAGGLGRFMRQNGDRLTRQIRAVVPVNLRGHDETDSLGNRFGLVFAPLPVALPDPVARMAAVHAAMERIKRSPEAGVLYGLLDLFGRTPRKALDLAVSFLGSKASLVLTNVPGPRRRIRFCGRGLDALIAWVPQSGRLGLGISVVSYGSELRLGVASDAGLVPDPQALVDACEIATLELLDAVGVREEARP